jgi:hypothetical protein
VDDARQPSQQETTAFLHELEKVTAREWKWEKWNRSWDIGINWAIWLARLFLLALSWFQLNWANASAGSSWVVLSLAILSAFNIALPLLAFTFRFRQRQKVHDFQAKSYTAIRVELDCGQISFSNAIRKFTETRLISTEDRVQNTP